MNYFKNFLFIFISLSLISCASNVTTNNTASTQENPQSLSSIETDNDNDPDKLICRREIVTGSNMRRKICRTRAERAEQSKEDRVLVNEAFQR